MLTTKRIGTVLVWAAVLCLPVEGLVGDVIDLMLRSRVEDTNEARFTEVEWDPQKTVIIVCDMWDEHWCESATRRVAEMAVPLNATLRAARAQGVFIVHAPSSVTSFYDETSQRKLALNAPRVPLPGSAKAREGWETGWCLWDDAVESPLPIDDSDGGCSCEEPECVAEMPWPWTRQIETIEIFPEDAVSDDGKEIWFLMEERGIENVILAGVHLNMCVLGRPFGIRQMVRTGKNVALMRDMTDTMYDPSSEPQVDHFTGTDMMIAHVEKYWAPSLVSSEFSEREAFRFSEDIRLESDSD